ncbi:LppP/LprE family lipoprotein [Nocardia barduliensis]|uniref:LppP/LprE family lipoprotein n=1 Tax=Nocardia barduliensis TaxID=2736643 RepID=UPI001573BCE2|nr:LppP/LprE family lipoprotein [Nocardia barduliensis]
MKTIIGAVATAIAVSVAVAGCQGATDTPATGTTEPGRSTVEVTRTAPGGETTPAPPAKPPATSGNGRCVDPGSSVVANAVNSLGPAPGGASYVVDSATDAPAGACPDLLWVLAATPRGTASSPWHVLFFNHGGYLGTATAKATSYTKVVGSSERSVQVQYRWLEGADANCCPSGGPVVITFTLGRDGRTVTPSPAIPDQVGNPGR